MSVEEKHTFNVKRLLQFACTASGKMSICVIMITYVHIFLATPALADNFGIQPISRMYNYWYVATEIEVQDDYAYVFDRKAGLQILDISDPRNPQQHGNVAYDSTWWTNGLTVHGNLAAIDMYSNVGLYDVSNPDQPIFLSDVAVREAGCVILTDTRLYARRYTFHNGASSTLDIFDISDPENPTHAGNLSGDQYTFRTFAVSEPYLYVLYGELNSVDLFVWDVSDPGDVAMVDRLDNPDPNSTFINLIRDGQTLYIVSHHNLLIGLSVVDISQPDRPVFRGECQIAPTVNIDTIVLSVDGNHVYCSYSPDWHTYALSTIDVSNPDNPMVSGTMELPGYINDFEARDGVAYCASGQDMIQVLSLNNPDEHDVIGRFHTARARSVSVAGDIAYLCADKDGLKIIDVSQSSNPVEIGAYICESYPQSLTVSDQLGFLSLDDGDVEILDLSHPTHPEQLAQIPTDSFARGASTYGNYALIADSSANLLIVDISDPEAPEIAGDFAFDTNQIVVVGNRAYLAGADGFCILDLSDPVNPVFIGDFGINFTSVAVYGDRVYLVNKNRGLFILDVSDPGLPLCRNLLDTPLAVNVEVFGDHCLLSDKFGISILALIDPDDPLEVGYYDTPGEILGATVSGSEIFVADWTNFEIYDCSEALSVRRSESQPVAEFGLVTPYPNPFNSTTTIGYTLPIAGNVSLAVYDLSGREVARLVDGVKAAGMHEAVWTADGEASGVFVVALDAGGMMQRQKVVLVK